MTKEVLKQALDVLKSKDTWGSSIREAKEDAIKALEEALETKDEPVAWGMETDGLIYDVICPAEHEREEGEYTIPLYTTPQPKQEQSEPVAWMTENKYLITKDENLAKQIKEQGDEPIIPLYTTPQRTWVCLTDAEVFELFGRFTTMTGKSWLDLYRMAETKLKEKNGY